MMERGWHEGSKSQQETGKRILRQSKRIVRDIKRDKPTGSKLTSSKLKCLNPKLISVNPFPKP
jgi:hypothetical protein